jgi:hypothetical protein
MSEEPKKVNEGWTWLTNSKKWHYFVGGRSLCGGFMIFANMQGKLEQGNNDSADNCASCKKKLKKRLEKNEKKTNQT